MLFVNIYGKAFPFIYLLCGLSDILDGYIARKTQTESEIGAKLDTIADITMFAIILFLVIPIISLSPSVVIWIVSIAAVRVISLVINYYKYHSFCMLHTYGNKVTGALLFCIPFLLNYVSIWAFEVVVCVVASISAVEELIINIISKKLVLNRRSLFK